MSQPEEWIVQELLRASLGLSGAALLVALLVRGLRLHAPRAEQCAWSMVLLQGVLLGPLAVSVPSHWMEVTPTQLSAGATVVFPFEPEPRPAAPQPILASDRASFAPAPAADAERAPKNGNSTVQLFLQSARLPWYTIAFVTWLGGIALLLGLGALRYLAFTKRMSQGYSTRADWLDEWRQVLSQQRVATAIPLVATEDVGPALCCLPTGYRLVVPRALWEELGPAERLAILHHEVAHFQRGDLWTALLARGVALLHWFNPLAWWALARFEAQSEFACDHAAAGDDPSMFAGVLIHLGSGRPSKLVAAQSAQTGRIAQRVRRLLSGLPRSPNWKGVLLVALAVIGLVPTAVRLQGVAMSSETAPPGETVDAAPRPGSNQKARALLQLGTNDLHTRDFIIDIAFSADGQRIAAVPANAPSPRVWLYDVSTGREVARIAPAEIPGRIQCVAFSPDQAKLLWGEIGGYVALWDLTNHRLLFRERLHRAGVNDVSFSTRGELMASAGDDGVVHVRRAANPTQELETFATGQQQLRSGGFSGGSGASCVVFTPDDTRLIAGTGSTADITIWRIADGSLIRRIERAHGNSLSFHANPKLNCLAVTPDGRRIMSSGQRTVPIAETKLKYGPKNVTMSEIRFWDIENGQQTHELHDEEDHGFGYACLAHDGKRVAVGDFGLLRILNAETGKPEQAIPLPGSWGGRPTFSPDGRLVAMPIHNAVGLFDVQTAKRLHHNERTPDNMLVSAAWSPAGDRIVTGHGDGKVRMWDAQTGHLIWHQLLAPVISRSGWNANPAFMTFSNDGRRVIVAGRRDDPVEYRIGIVGVYEATFGKLVYQVSYETGIWDAALSPDGEILVIATSNGSADDTRLHGIDVETGRMLYTTPPDEVQGGLWQMKAMRFLPDTTRLVVALGNGEVIGFNGLTGKELHRFVADWRSAEQRQADQPRLPQLWEGAFSADGRTLVSSSAEYLYVWNVDAGELRRKTRHPHDHSCRVCVAPDGKTIATSDLQYPGSEDTIRLYDLRTGEQLMQAEPDDNRAHVLAFSPDSTRLFSGFHRGSATVWDVRR